MTEPAEMRDDGEARRPLRYRGPLVIGAFGQWAMFTVCTATAAIIVVVYAASGDDPAQVAAVGFAIIAASIVAGGLVGFLFALPRSVTVTVPATGTRAASRLVVRPNTNLEDVSDWLTKIIIGLTLTQIGKIPPAAGRLFDYLGGALGERPASTVLAGGIVIYSLCVGFDMAWLLTRIYIGRWMAAADIPGNEDDAAAHPPDAGG